MPFLVLHIFYTKFMSIKIFLFFSYNNFENTNFTKEARSRKTAQKVDLFGNIIDKNFRKFLFLLEKKNI